jgi:hypothetical protein
MPPSLVGTHRDRILTRTLKLLTLSIEAWVTRGNLSTSAHLSQSTSVCLGGEKDLH